MQPLLDFGTPFLTTYRIPRQIIEALETFVYPRTNQQKKTISEEKKTISDLLMTSTCIKEASVKKRKPSVKKRWDRIGPLLEVRTGFHAPTSTWDCTSYSNHSRQRTKRYGDNGFPC